MVKGLQQTERSLTYMQSFFNIIHSEKNNLERKGLGRTLCADISTRKQIDLDMIKPEFQERF